MDVVAFLVDLTLLIFVLVALGQLFSISASLRRLVQLAETPATARVAVVQDGSLAVAELPDENLLSRWNATRDPAAEAELKERGYHMG